MDLPSFDRNNWLKCPRCSGGNLHQENVVINYRLKEDGDAISTFCDGTQVKTKIVKNTPGRRQSLLIAFSCEGCGNQPRLIILQHKGSTHVGWYDDVGAEDPKEKT